jgi:hypothetical protein
MASSSDRLYIARSGAAANTSVAVATVAATAKTVVAVLGSSTDTLSLKRVRVSFNSVTASDVPALVEVGIITTAGTPGTSFTPVQVVGQSLASSATAGYNHSAEPTYNRILDATYVPVNNGLFEFWYPLGEEPVCSISQGFGIRVTSPQAQSVFASIYYSE